MEKIAIISMFALISLSGCVKFECYSNSDYARKQANKFCNQANGNKTLCESLVIEKKACVVSEKDENICEASNDGIKAFVRMAFSDCFGLMQNACQAQKQCTWSFDHLNPIPIKCEK